MQAEAFQRAGSPPMAPLDAGLMSSPSSAVPRSTEAPALNAADEWRRRASELVETLVAALGKPAETGVADTERVPLLRAAAPVHAGEHAKATIRIVNEESTPSRVMLYATNFVADSGYELPSLAFSATPRVATIAPGGAAAFEVTLKVPQQAPPGVYSGLIQAAGSRYVKAVLMLDVL
jgi:hypothetical protein